MKDVESLQKPLVVDSNSDSDECYDTGKDSTTTSIASSVLHYEYENGRRYHSYQSGKYTMPNDEEEQDRLDMFHHVFRIMLGGRLYLAPLKNPQRILDIGTGTGIWVMDVATEFPSAKVIGTDLSPIQPTWVPPNCQFIVDDADTDWVFAKESFDYIHVRCLVGAIRNWPRLIKQAYEHLVPGGYIEIVEFPKFELASDDGTYHPGLWLYKYYQLINKASIIRGCPISPDPPLKGHVVDVGFEVETFQFKLPFGPWPADKRQKELGRWMQLISQSGFEAYGLALFSRQLGMTKESVRELIEGSKKDIDNRKIHGYAVVEIIVGKKPLGGKAER